MSQKSQSDGGQKHFAVGRGLLAAAETLNFSMNEQRSGRQMGGAASGVGVGGGGGGSGMDNQDGGSQMSRRGGGGHIGNTMKLFASLGLSPSDLDALAEIPEEDISVETLPRILMQLKSRKGDAGERRGASSVSSDAGYRGGRDSWDNAHMGRMGGPSLGTGSARGQTSADFGYSSLRERPYSELSHHDSYGGGLSIGPPASDPGFRQRRIGSPSNGKVQDFLGVTPPMFPHVCSLCDFDVHSTMVSTHQPPPSLLPGTNFICFSSDSGASSLCQSLRSRVVVVKYDRKPLSNKTLFSFTEPFGRLTEHLVLKNKAFLEMSSHEEAVDMVNYYEQQQASLYGKPLSFYLSRRLMVIEVPKVVYVGQIPNTKYSDDAVLKLAEPFGRVKKYFLNRLKREVRNQNQVLNPVSVLSRENSSMSPSSSQQPEEPPAKKCKEEEKEPEEEEQVEVEVEVTGEAEEVQSCDDEKKEEKSSEDIPEVSDRNQTSSQEVIGDEFNEPVCAPPSCRRRSRRRRRWTHRPIRTDVPRPPRVEHVKMGFYCRVCFLFYSNEETAKKTHCSSQTHHDKLFIWFLNK
uniref:Matrin 3-like 1.1 n=1 Tax=Cyclopterus lumpus TaxID=8103 RepID=A0A8C3G595_CYCLU